MRGEKKNTREASKTLLFEINEDAQKFEKKAENGTFMPSYNQKFQKEAKRWFFGRIRKLKRPCSGESD